MERELDAAKLHAAAVILPIHTRPSGRIWLHFYELEGIPYFRFSNKKDGAVKASAVYRDCIILSDAAAVVGGALYALLEGKNVLKRNIRQTLKYLTAEGLQLAINSAFEPSEITFAKLEKQYKTQIALRAKQREGRMKRRMLKMEVKEDEE